jgi:hypothetical protein
MNDQESAQPYTCDPPPALPASAVEQLLGELDRPVPLEAFQRWAGGDPTPEQLAAAGWEVSDGWLFPPESSTRIE